MNPSEWRKTPIKGKDFSVDFDSTDHYMENNYFGEVKTLCLRLLNEYKTIARSGVDVTILNENQILNTLFPGSSLVTFMALMDHSLVNTLVQFAKLVQCSHISLPGGMDSDVLPSSNHLILT